MSCRRLRSCGAWASSIRSSRCRSRARHALGAESAAAGQPGADCGDAEESGEDDELSADGGTARELVAAPPRGED